MNIKDDGFTEKQFPVDKYNKKALEQIVKEYETLGWENQELVREKH